MTLPMAVDRRHLQHVGQHELRGAVLGVLVEQFVEDLRGPRRRTASKKSLLLAAQPLGALAPGAQRRVEREVAEQVERVGVGLAGRVGEVVEVDAALLQLLR